MRTLSILLSLQILTLFTLLAQENTLQAALEAYQNKQYADARTNIELAISSTENSSDASAWYLRGFIYKDSYKSGSQNINESISWRELAIDSYSKTMELDNEGKYTSDCKVSLNFLTTSFFNDAVNLMNSQEYKSSQANFDAFKKHAEFLETGQINFEEKEIEYYLAYGSNLFEQDSLEEEAIEVYNKVLELDSGNVKANYSLGVIYYNRAVSLITDIDYEEVDLVAFTEIEDRSVEYFKQALPYMESAYATDSTNQSVIEGLAGIYFSLREFDRSDYYKSLLGEQE